MKIDLDVQQFWDVMNVGAGAFAPIDGFMGLSDLISVIETNRTESGVAIGYPVLFYVAQQLAQKVSSSKDIDLYFAQERVAVLQNPTLFRWDGEDSVEKLFGTKNSTHPGVQRVLSAPKTLIQGKIHLDVSANPTVQALMSGPASIREKVFFKGWKTIAGFQTRNVPHKAHEYLVRLALEFCDGVLIQPMVGQRKPGDFTAGAISRGYEVLIDHFLPEDRVLFSPIFSNMFFAGPREALLHAVMRRNFGCTHFIVGRDHAGVDSFYGAYEAQSLAKLFEGELGITILNFGGPFYCRACDSIATERSCRHLRTDPDKVVQISGTQIRNELIKNQLPDERIARHEVMLAAQQGDIFE